MIKITSLDHFVLTVADLEASCGFYQRVLGFDKVRFDDGRLGLAFSGQRINLHELGASFTPKALRPTPGSADFCFITSTPIKEVLAGLGECGIVVELGPVPRTGASGPMTSVYIRDPDGNLIEIATYV